jgi:hypothetical protein
VCHSRYEYVINLGKEPAWISLAKPRVTPPFAKAGAGVEGNSGTRVIEHGSFENALFDIHVHHRESPEELDREKVELQSLIGR